MGRLILLRHGQSAWNESGRFTGWVDVPLTEKGIEEASQAGRELSDESIDVVFTSVLFRAIMTSLFIGLERHDHPILSLRRSFVSSSPQLGHLEIFCHDALNERFYGDLQGSKKEEMIKTYGEEKVHLWRRGLYDQPPGGESIFETSLRVVPFFQEKIVPYLSMGWTVLLVAHSNSLRALMIYLEKLGEKEIEKLELSTGVPRYYSYSSIGGISWVESF